MRFLHLSDLHLGSRHPELGDRAEAREREVLETFRRAVEFACDPSHGIQAVLIAGNLFDHHRPDPEVFAFARGLFGQLAAADLPVIAVPGARDGYGYRDGVFRTEKLPGVTLLTPSAPQEPHTMTIDGQTVHFYGAAGRPGVSPAAFPGFTRTDAEGLHIGLVTASLRAHPEFAERPRVWAIDEETVRRSGLDYLALGGYHEHTPIADGERLLAAYPGTLEGRRFESGDLGEKCLLVLDVEPGQATAQRHPVSRRRLETWEIDLADERIEEPGDLVAALLARGSEDLIARVTLTGTTAFLCDLREIVRAVKHAFYHLEIVDRSDLLGSPLLARLEGEKTIRGIFVRRLMRHYRELMKRASESGPTSGAASDLETAKLALKLGLEQFLEDEGPDLTPRPRATEVIEEAPVMVEDPAEVAEVATEEESAKGAEA